MPAGVWAPGRKASRLGSLSGIVGPEFMLSVRIDGREVETTPVSLAQMVLDGRVDRCSRAKTSGGESEQSLEQSLGSSYCETLTSELLQRLRAMYSLEPAVDMQELRVRVEDLCQWHWASPHIAARFFWAAAWLNELMDRLESAAAFYDACLQVSSSESHLRLLAYNNRGVLRIRLGRLEGVQDLARAAIPAGGLRTADCGLKGTFDARPQSAGLPAACFNLLNLVNVSLGMENLTRAVDEELADFFLHLPVEVRSQWLGPESGEETDQPTGAQLGRSGGSEEGLLILRDPTFRRLNALTTHLAAQARRWIADCELRSTDSGRAASPLVAPERVPAGQSAGRGSPSFLSLWECRCDGDGSRAFGVSRGASPPVLARYAGQPVITGPRSTGYAEAVSLLLSEDVPSSLLRLESPLSRMEQAAQEELADIEGRLTLEHHELIRSRLQAQHRLLSALNYGGRLAGLLARVDAQLERIAQIEAQEEHLEYQRACARLSSDVEQFCRITDLCQAEKELEDLGRRLQRLTIQPSAETGRAAGGLLEELDARVARHMGRLRRLEIRRRIRVPLRQMRRNWPTDWTTPVPESMYRILAQCHLNDPDGTIEDWSQLKDQLDAHQGRYHLRTALAALQANGVTWDRIQEDIARALGLKPDLWLMAAPLFGLSCSQQRTDTDEDAANTQAALWAAAGRLFSAMPQALDASKKDRASGPIQQAGHLLEHAFRQTATDSRRTLRLWQCVEATLSPVLARGGIEAIAEVRALAERCLDHWPVAQASIPGPADPRNPVNLFLESCEKARGLVEAEQLLNARPPRLEEARRRYAEVIGSGLDTRDQLRRVVTGLYLAEFRQQDAPQMQRQMLSRLEAWVEAVADEARQRLGARDVVCEIERSRAALSAGQSVPVAGGAPPGGSARDGVERASAGGGCDDTRDGPETDHHNSQEEPEQPGQ